MSDMLVKLYDLPNPGGAVAALERQGVRIRPAMSLERPAVLRWIRTHFVSWLPEVETGFCRQPIPCLLAIKDRTILGFACYDVTCRNFFGPMGVLESARGEGIGSALLLTALQAQRSQGYGYAIIGGVGPVGFYERAVGATVIEGSSPGVYPERLF